MMRGMEQEPAEDASAGWQAHREASQDKRSRNRDYSADLLRNRGIEFTSRNDGAHLIVRVGDARLNFWPGTGKWQDSGGVYHRGVRGLIRYVEGRK